MHGHQSDFRHDPRARSFLVSSFYSHLAVITITIIMAVAVIIVVRDGHVCARVVECEQPLIRCRGISPIRSTHVVKGRTDGDRRRQQQYFKQHWSPLSKGHYKLWSSERVTTVILIIIITLDLLNYKSERAWRV